MRRHPLPRLKRHVERRQAFGAEHQLLQRGYEIMERLSGLFFVHDSA